VFTFFNLRILTKIHELLDITWTNKVMHYKVLRLYAQTWRQGTGEVKVNCKVLHFIFFQAGTVTNPTI